VIGLRRHLLTDDHGGAAIEFGIVAPLLLMTILGIFDMGHGMYTASLLNGSIEKAARDSTIEAASTGTLDTTVANIVREIAPGATMVFARQAYTNFSNVRQAEDFTDSNANNVCDANEPFEDANGSGSWDSDMGRSGNGGARDAVLYKVTVTYDRIFPVWQMIGQSGTMTIKAAAVLRNQPYALQESGGAVGTCP
jgi:Flp pilus assembly protein TadG